MPKRSSELETYRQKRDFTKTSEPAPRGIAKRAPRGGGRFVVQHHWARREHYDFRIEMEGVLKSWAVTKPPSPDPAVKRLAVRTEDHPLDYATFEGTIPKGEYGGGTVMLWDEGIWQPVDSDPIAALAKGQLKMSLDGERMKGGWVLVRLKPEGKRENWLLIKERDEHVERGGDLGAKFPTSVATGRSKSDIEENRPSRKRSPPRKAVQESTGRPASRRASSFLPLMLCELRDKVPEGPNWLHEVKYDGYRVEAAVAGSEVRLYSREGLDWTHRFGTVPAALARLDLPPAVLDGEAVVFDAKGVSNFASLVDALDSKTSKIVYLVFDILRKDRRDLRTLPLLERKEILHGLLGGSNSGTVRETSYIVGNGSAVLEKALKAGAEGIVSKRVDAPYREGRGGQWVKVKDSKREDVVVIGWMPSERRRFASLVVAQETPQGLRHAGNVGSGFSEAELGKTLAKLEPLRLPHPPPGVIFEGKPPKGAVWVEPRHRIEVAFTEPTRDKRLRHPRFLGWREDRSDPPNAAAKPAARKKPARSSKQSGDSHETQLQRISSGERVVYPEVGVTKAEVAAFYLTVSDRLLPHLEDRPVSLVRAPEGLSGERFFQRHPLPGMTRGIKRVKDPRGGHPDYLIIEGVEGLMTAAQFGVLEFHGWGARVPHLDRVDRIIFDLDPDEGVDFADVRAAAFEVRKLLEAVDLKTFALISGGKGVHVVAPLDGTQNWDEIGDFTGGIARGLTQADPSRFLAVASKARRKGKIFVDWLRNRWTATAILPWSLRARPKATVAMPVSWKELETIESADVFTIANAAARRDPWRGFFATKQRISDAALRHLRRRVP
ncbi:MAG TPA: DNA ligase D [Aestuariivirgaceae bacterium]|nr:DNA ligase D [Aestuariivirgaceae bacterium]